MTPLTAKLAVWAMNRQKNGDRRMNGFSCPHSPVEFSPVSFEDIVTGRRYLHILP
jgi:hypothetical protein